MKQKVWLVQRFEGTEGLSVFMRLCASKPVALNYIKEYYEESNQDIFSVAQDQSFEEWLEDPDNEWIITEEDVLEEGEDPYA
jgi:hypothetical protein